VYSSRRSIRLTKAGGPLGLVGSVQQIFGHKSEHLDERDPRFARIVVGPLRIADGNSQCQTNVVLDKTAYCRLVRFDQMATQTVAECGVRDPLARLRI